jgi:curved DNA-binding protein
MEYKDYYQVMGVARSATQDDIKRAYRQLARKYHPDVNQASDAEARFKELGEAYEVLKDPEKRAAYDRLGSQWKQGHDFQPPPGWNSGFETSSDGSGGFEGQDMGEQSDFFESLFRRGFARRQSEAAGGAGFHAQGQDSHAKIEIRLEEAYHGGSRRVTLQMPQVDAQGRVVLREHPIEFNIPRGVRAGQRIRLAGQGGLGLGEGPRGDLYLEVAFLPHPHYRVDKHDVYLNLPVAPWEAALGAVIEAPTPSGSVELTVPANSAEGRKLRLKGRGIPGKTPGDFYFVLKIAVPPADSETEKAAYREMAKTFASFNPRRELKDLGHMGGAA